MLEHFVVILVAKSLLEKGQVTFLGNMVTIHKPAVNRSTKPRVCQKNIVNSLQASPSPQPVCESAKTILISGLPKGIDREQLELYFENQKRSGGGKIQDIQMYPEGQASVTFVLSQGLPAY